MFRVKMDCGADLQQQFKANLYFAPNQPNRNHSVIIKYNLFYNKDILLLLKVNQLLF